MRRSIRDQILIPLIAVQVATAATSALLAAKLASDRAEAEVARQLVGVVETLGGSNFPLTSVVLEKMRGLSGAHFVASSSEGAVMESTLSGLRELPTALRSLPSRPRLDPPGWSAQVVLQGEGYFAASVRSSSGPNLVVLYPEADWRRARWEAAVPPMVVGLLSMAPMALVTGVVAHRLGRRLRSVESRVAAIAAGDFRRMDDRGRGDEVGDLVDSVNRMVEQLRQMREAIRRTERSGVLAQLAAGLAHQLRNAATGARMAVQLHARRCPSGQTEGSLSVALRQLSLCEEQVKGLLALGRPDSQPPAPCEAAEVVREVADLVEPACRHSGVELSVHVTTRPRILAHFESLRGALLNLALNAVEACGSGGKVALELGIVEEEVQFLVIDNGPGPAPELAPTLFEPFVTGKAEGVGQGLTLARRVALDHGGTLSWSRDQGLTRFRLALPRSPDEDEG